METDYFALNRLRTRKTVLESFDVDRGIAGSPNQQDRRFLVVHLIDLARSSSVLRLISPARVLIQSDIDTSTTFEKLAVGILGAPDTD